jgi:hypothetical protein
MVTHSSTSRPVQCLCMAERTGCPVFTDLWSYVLMKRTTTVLYFIVITIYSFTSSLLCTAIKLECLRCCNAKGAASKSLPDQTLTGT